MDWMRDTWMPDPGKLDWPFYGWLRARHLAAVAKLDEAMTARAAVEGRFASEDLEAAGSVERTVRERRAAITAALGDGREPPAEEPIAEPAPASGPVRRQVELGVAEEAIARAELDVHIAAAQTVATLPAFLYEAEESVGPSVEAACAEIREREQAKHADERELRERFHGESVLEVKDSDRCEHCSLEALDWAVYRVVDRERRSQEGFVGGLPSWVLGRPSGVADYSPAQRPVYLGPQPFTTWLAELNAITGLGLPTPDVVCRWVHGRDLSTFVRPDSPSVEEIAAMSVEEREALFRERLERQEAPQAAQLAPAQVPQSLDDGQLDGRPLEDTEGERIRVGGGG